MQFPEIQEPEVSTEPSTEAWEPEVQPEANRKKWSLSLNQISVAVILLSAVLLAVIYFTSHSDSPGLTRIVTEETAVTEQENVEYTDYGTDSANFTGGGLYACNGAYAAYRDGLQGGIVLRNLTDESETQLSTYLRTYNLKGKGYCLNVYDDCLYYYDQEVGDICRFGLETHVWDRLWLIAPQAKEIASETGAFRLLVAEKKLFVFCGSYLGARLCVYDTAKLKQKLSAKDVAFPVAATYDGERLYYAVKDCPALRCINLKTLRKSEIPLPCLAENLCVSDEGLLFKNVDEADSNIYLLHLQTGKCDVLCDVSAMTETDRFAFIVDGESILCTTAKREQPDMDYSFSLWQINMHSGIDILQMDVPERFYFLYPDIFRYGIVKDRLFFLSCDGVYFDFQMSELQTGSYLTDS